MLEPLGADHDEEFRHTVLVKAKERWHRSMKQGLAVIGMLVGLAAIASAVSLVLLHNRTGPLSTQGDSISNLRNQLVTITISHSLRSIAVLAIALLVLVAMAFAIHDMLTYLVNTRLLLWLFCAPPYRTLYQKVTSLGSNQRQRAGRWPYIVLAIIILGVLAFLYLARGQIAWSDQASFQAHFRVLALPVALGGVLASILACVPAMQFYVRGNIDPDLDRTGFQRYLIFRLSRLALIPIVVLLIGQVAFPSLLQVCGHVYRTYILSEYKSDALEIRAAVTAIDAEDTLNQQRQERLLSYLDELLTSGIEDYDSIAAEILNFALPLALNLAVWVFFTDIALLFVLPYLALGGWHRGLFYVALLGAAFSVDNALQQSAPAWFSLRPGSISSVLIVAFVVFANALFFDWLFEMLVEKKKMCPGCQVLLGASDAYCRSCGLIQP